MEYTLLYRIADFDTNSVYKYKNIAVVLFDIPVKYKQFLLFKCRFCIRVKVKLARLRYST